MNYAMITPERYARAIASHCAPSVDTLSIAPDFDLTPAIKKTLIGATVIWEDSNPLSMDDEMLIRYYFDTNTNAIEDVKLMRHGLYDPAQFASMRFQWFIEMVNHYTKPNREAGEKPHTERHAFYYTGKVYPMGDKIKRERDAFFMQKNIEFSMVPDDHKNKKVYQKTVFTATVLGLLK